MSIAISSAALSVLLYSLSAILKVALTTLEPNSSLFKNSGELSNAVSTGWSEVSTCPWLTKYQGLNLPFASSLSTSPLVIFLSWVTGIIACSLTLEPVWNILNAFSSSSLPL